MKLIMIHHAGGSSLYYKKWLKHLNFTDNILVEMPGHMMKDSEPLIYQFDVAVAEVTRQITLELGRNEKYMIFGHSMGALLAFYATCSLIKKGYSYPVCLFLSGSSSPDFRQDRVTNISKIENDADFINEVVKLGGMPPEVLDSQELMDYCIPILRADFSIVESLEYKPLEPIECDGHILNGIDDVGAAGSMSQWSKFFTGHVTEVLFPGNHFYTNEHFKEICELIRKVSILQSK